MAKTLKEKADGIAHWITLISVLGGLALGGVFWGKHEGEFEERSFPDSGTKHEVINSVLDGPTAVERAEQRLLDSMNTIHAIRSRERRDSALFAEMEQRKIGDSINKLNSDQLYQIKKILEKNGMNFEDDNN